MYLAIIKQILNTVLPGVRVNDDTELFKTGLLDSLQIVEFILLLNQEFKVKLTPLDFDIKKWATPALVANIIHKKYEDLH